MRHLRRPLAIVPASWLGRGQLLFFFILWCFVIANFAKSLGYFGPGRLLTEGVITVSAVIATMLILTLPRTEATFDSSLPKPARFGGFLTALTIAAIMAACVIPAETHVVRKVYGDTFAGHGGKHLRFGDEARQNIEPILKHERHR